ncbi:MAG TPA: hypothetical protein VIU02_12915, partial [Burkholderiales bacterium]
MNETDRVAIVVVHGIADQRPGQTVREVARLLCHGGEGEPRYVQGELHEVLVPVEKLEPGPAAQAGQPVSHPGPAKKDPSRDRPGAPSGFFATQQVSAPPLSKATPGEPAAEPQAKDLGVAMNDYLLGRLQLAEGDMLYESTRASLRRRQDDRSADVYEMYWADLSRLGEGGLRALTSLYQLFFHINTLGAGIVDQVSLSVGGSTRWRLLQRFHAWLAWLMKVPMALL